jgi:hypothetical protein
LLAHRGGKLKPVAVQQREPSILGYVLVDGVNELKAAKTLKLGGIDAIVLPHKRLRPEQLNLKD